MDLASPVLVLAQYGVGDIYCTLGHRSVCLFEAAFESSSELFMVPSW
jgi:hypothetical protein